MEAPSFRSRVTDAAARVAERTGVDPLDLRRSMAATTDARLEMLPRSVGIGCALLAAAILVMIVRFLVAPAAGPGDAATAGFAAVDVALFGAAAATLVIARAARARREDDAGYEDAWARLAVEVWPAPRYQSWNGRPGTAGVYSRTEFLVAVGSGADLSGYERHAPFTRLP